MTKPILYRAKYNITSVIPYEECYFINRYMILDKSLELFTECRHTILMELFRND